MDTISVSTSSVPDMGWAGLRQILTAVGGVLMAHGYVSQSNWTLIAGLVTAIAPIIWGQIATHVRAQQLADLAKNPAVTQVQPK